MMKVYNINEPYQLPESAYDLGFAFGEINVSEYVLSADFLKLLILLFFLLFLFFFLFVFKDAATFLTLPDTVATMVSSTAPRNTSIVFFF
jgi:hypothetical protein